MINRRNFLKASAASTLAGVSALNVSNNQAFAQTNPSDFKTLVCVFMDGGNDSFNMLMPNTTAEFNAYARSRQGVALEKSDLQLISPNGLGTNSFGLNPEMSALKKMFDDGDASLIANIGSLIEPTNKADILNESALLPTGLGGHSRGRSYWKGDHDNSVNSSRDGIGGRLANQFVNSSRLPNSYSSAAGHDLFLTHADQDFYGISQFGLIKMHDYDLAQPDRYANTASTTRRSLVNKLNVMGAEEKNIFLRHSGQLFSDGIDANSEAQGFLEDVDPINVEFQASPLTGVAIGLRNAVPLIQIRQQLGQRRQIIFVRASGFDRHDRLNVWHNPAMREISESLASFNAAMKELGVDSSVLTYTGSDFGRTLTNTGTGTDHAWGGNQILMGGGIKGGELFGSYPVLELDGDEDYNGDGRMIPSTSITQHAATIAKWFGVPQNRLSEVVPNIVNFPGQEDLGFFA